MALPSLRQPKCMNNMNTLNNNAAAVAKNVIVTLRGDFKLVVTTDSYNGILLGKEMYKCIFCKSDMQLDENYKDFHIDWSSHKELMSHYPHLDDYGENLIRKLNDSEYYCTICNSVVSSSFIRLHVSSHNHNQNLIQAVERASTYHPIEPK